MTELTTKQISDRLIAMDTAMTEKLDAQPYFAAELTITGGRNWSVRLWATRTSGPARFRSEGISEALDLADAFITKMPAAHDMKQHEWQKKLAGLIDEAHDLSLPNEVVDPLRASSQAMTENLLAAE